MFVKSIKLSRANLLIFAGVVILAITGLVVLFSTPDSVPTAGKVSTSTQAVSPDQREAFLKSFGWEIDQDPKEITEVLIPTEFDATYEKYNIIQKRQGFDLSDYKGKRVKMWVYNIKNYPDYKGNVRATLLIHNGNIIGGDISAEEKNKFTHGFKLDS